VFGYNYNENIRNGNTWVQLQTNLNRFSLFGAAEIGLTQLWRTGKTLNPRFPDNSLGDSEKQSYYTYGAKAGVTFKANGRNYLYVNGFTGTRPPQFREIFLSPRNRNSVVAGADAYSIQSAEAGYIHRAPTFRTRVTAFAQVLTAGMWAWRARLNTNRFLPGYSAELATWATITTLPAR
jgi:hypothetical protein